jgi:hypothetical protein
VKPDDVNLWLPLMLTLLGTAMAVTFTAWLSTRSVHAIIAEVRQAIRVESAELREELKQRFGSGETPSASDLTHP